MKTLLMILTGISSTPFFSCKEKYICSCEYSPLAKAIGVEPKKTDTIYASRNLAKDECLKREKTGFVSYCIIK